MQVTIDIPEPLYREVESVAKAAHKSVAELALDQLNRVASMRGRYPLIKSNRPGSMDLSKIDVNDFLDNVDPS